MNNIDIQTIKEFIQNPARIDIQFYADYWFYEYKGQDVEFQSNRKDDMDAIPDHAEQHDAFQIDIDQWPQLFDDSLNITVNNQYYDESCKTLECTLESSDGTYVNCYINIDT